MNIHGGSKSKPPLKPNYQKIVLKPVKEI